jgi:tRNA dimethylallyltransferase
LRKKLENKNIDELYNELKEKDPEAAIITGEKNKRRIVRALEVIYETGKKFSEQRKAENPIFDPIKIGMNISKENFLQNVSFRLKEMLKNGLISEVNRLQRKYSWALSPMHSIDYQEFKDYLEGKTTLDETKKLITKHHADYARRQMTWFKKDKSINWISSEEEAAKLISDFLKK